MDRGYDPGFVVWAAPDGNVVIVCDDWFKLKPNKMLKPALRSDIYLQKEAAVGIGAEITALLGSGAVGKLLPVDPEGAHTGSRALPRRGKTREARYIRFEIDIAGYRISAGPGTIFVELEKPNPAHTMMREDEVHLGIKFDPMDQDAVTGELNESLVEVLDDEPRARGSLRITFTPDQARSLAATLQSLGTPVPAQQGLP
jgi:hypothetical protein